MTKRLQYWSDDDQISSDQENISFNRGRPSPQSSASQIESGTEWIFEGDFIISSEENHGDDACSPDVLQLVRETLSETYFSKCPGKIDYLVIFHDTKGSSITYCEESKEFILQYNIRAYMQGRCVAREQMEKWIKQPLLWTKASGILLMDLYINDLKIAADPSSSAQILLEYGNRTRFLVRSTAWSFAGSIEIDHESYQSLQDASLSLQEFVRTKFDEISTIPIPEILKTLAASFCTVQCGIENLARGLSAPTIPIRGFVSSSSQSEIAKYLAWLPSFSFKAISGGLGSEPQFQAAVDEARDESSTWIEIFTIGELRRNNRSRLAKFRREEEDEQVCNY